MKLEERTEIEEKTDMAREERKEGGGLATRQKENQ